MRIYRSSLCMAILCNELATNSNYASLMKLYLVRSLVQCLVPQHVIMLTPHSLLGLKFPKYDEFLCVLFERDVESYLCISVASG